MKATIPIRSEPRAAFPGAEHDHGRCYQDLLCRTRAAFEARSLRWTALRRMVLEEIASSHRAVGAYDLIESLAAKGQRRAPISIYRALDALAEVGAIHRLESRNAFFACHRPHAGGAGRIALVCERCLCVAEIDSAETLAALDAVVDASGFSASRTMIEVSGLCQGCAGRAANRGMPS